MLICLADVGECVSATLFTLHVLTYLSAGLMDDISDKVYSSILFLLPPMTEHHPPDLQRPRLPCHPGQHEQAPQDRRPLERADDRERGALRTAPRARPHLAPPARDVHDTAAECARYVRVAHVYATNMRVLMCIFLTGRRGRHEESDTCKGQCMRGLVHAIDRVTAVERVCELCSSCLLSENNGLAVCIGCYAIYLTTWMIYSL